MRPLRCLLLAAAILALRAEDDIAATAKNDVEVALHAAADGASARLTAFNRNDYAATVSVMVAFTVDQSDEKAYSLTLPAGAHGALEQPIAVTGSTTLANLRITSVDRAAVCVASGYVQQACARRDGVTVTAFSAPADPQRWYLVFSNENDHAVHVSYLWNLDAQPVVDRRVVPANGKAGAHGEIVQRVRAPNDDRDQTRAAFTIEAVLPR